MLSSILLSLALLAAPQQTENRVLIVGDSWSAYTTAFGSLDQAFADAGHPDKLAVGDTTAIGGSTAADWTTPAYQALITQALAQNPDVDVVHLTIGGNDFFAGWNVGMGATAEAALFDQIADDVESVIDFIQSQRAGVQVVLSTYDYPNFDEELAANPLYVLLYASMGFPSAAQLNDAGARGQLAIGREVFQKPNVHVIHHFGLTHFLRGYPAKGMAPRTSAKPLQWRPGRAPMAGGDSNLFGTPEWLLDPIHLNDIGYYWVAAHCTFLFYDDYFDANP